MFKYMQFQSISLKYLIRCIFQVNGSIMSWNQIEKLWKVDLGHLYKTKLTSDHIYLSPQSKMKVNLAVQVKTVCNYRTDSEHSEINIYNRKPVIKRCCYGFIFLAGFEWIGWTHPSGVWWGQRSRTGSIHPTTRPILWYDEHKQQEWSWQEAQAKLWTVHFTKRQQIHGNILKMDLIITCTCRILILLLYICKINIYKVLYNL